MRQIAEKKGYIHKKTIVKDDLFEVINHYGNSMILWSGKDLELAPIGQNKENSEHHKYINTIEDSVKNLTGIYVQHPDGWCLKHGDKKYISNSESSEYIRTLPVITVEELEKSVVSSTDNADTAISRLTGSSLTSTLTSTEDYDTAFVKLSDSSKEFFLCQDHIMAELVESTRSIRDKISRTNIITSEQTDAIQKRETMLELMHTHSHEMSKYAKYLNEVTQKLNEMKEEMNNMYATLG